MSDTWTVVEMRWRLIRAGDVVLDPDGNPWMVDRTPGERMLTLDRGAESFDKIPNPSDLVRVLVPTADAAAVVTLREQLGPVRVLDRA